METKIYQCLVKINEALINNKEFLTELDGAIGDADHGINMGRGFGEVVKAIPKDEEDIGVVLKKVGMTLLSKVGGASGPLYGTAFMKAATSVKGCKNITVDQVVTVVEDALNGIKYRGKAVRGEKTMIDSIEPALDAIKECSEQGKSLEESLDAAYIAANKGVEGTKLYRATKGRASYLGDRSIGHQDPGATSSMIILEAIINFLKLDKTEMRGM
jgi:dihydroxyacetone kinase-like protein